MKKKIKKIMAKEYSYSFVPPVKGALCQDWFGEIREFPGCMTQHKTLKKTYKHLRKAMKIWIEISLEQGLEIPEPGNYWETKTEVIQLLRKLEKQELTAWNFTNEPTSSKHHFMLIIIRKIIKKVETMNQEEKTK